MCLTIAKQSSTSFRKNCEQKTELYLIRIYINTTTTRQLCASSRERINALWVDETESEWVRRLSISLGWTTKQNVGWSQTWIKNDSHLNTRAIYNIFIFYVPLSIRYGLNYQKKRLNGANKLHFLDHHFHPPVFFPSSQT